MLRARKTTDGAPRKRLGRGLESLISRPVPIDVSQPAPATRPQHASSVKPQNLAPTGSSQPEVAEQGLLALPVEAIHPNRRQPRQAIDDAGLEALAQSIRQAGVMQPIVVRSRPAGGYELVAGERRWRAAQRIGLATIPAVVRDVDDRAAAELALVENIQREDLNPIDRAEAFERLINDFQLTHQELAERVGLDRSTITNFTRLNALDQYTRDLVRTGKISLGHAKVLLAITNDKARADLATRIVRQDWSVRELERHVQQLRDAKSGGASAQTATKPQAPHLADLQRRLSEHLGTKVRIRPGVKKGTGSITIDFYSLDQFDGLMERMGFSATDADGA